MARHDAFPFEPGDVVSVRFGVVLSHYGVVTSRGTILSNSRLYEGVIEQTPEAFATGRTIKRHRRYSTLDAHLVESRARRQIGRDYDLFGSNCGHFVRHAHRRKPTPMQIGAATVRALGDMLSGKRNFY